MFLRFVAMCTIRKNLKMIRKMLVMYLNMVSAMFKVQTH